MGTFQSQLGAVRCLNRSWGMGACHAGQVTLCSWIVSRFMPTPSRVTCHSTSPATMACCKSAPHRFLRRAGAHADGHVPRPGLAGCSHPRSGTPSWVCCYRLTLGWREAESHNLPAMPPGLQHAWLNTRVLAFAATCPPCRSTRTTVNAVLPRSVADLPCCLCY